MRQYRNCQSFVSNEQAQSCCVSLSLDSTHQLHYHSEPPENTPSIEMNQSYKSQWCCVVQMATELAGLNALQVLPMGLYVYKRWGVYSVWVMIFAKVRQPITAAIALVTRGTLHKVWDELYHCLNIGHVSHRAHVEFLWGVCKTLIFSLLDCCRCEVCSILLFVFCIILKVWSFLWPLYKYKYLFLWPLYK